MDRSNLIEGFIVITFVLVVIALPYFCCQISNEEYQKITTRMREIKLEQLKKKAETKEPHLNNQGDT